MNHDISTPTHTKPQFLLGVTGNHLAGEGVGEGEQVSGNGVRGQGPARGQLRKWYLLD